MLPVAVVNVTVSDWLVIKAEVLDAATTSDVMSKVPPLTTEEIVSCVGLIIELT